MAHEKKFLLEVFWVFFPNENTVVIPSVFLIRKATTYSAMATFMKLFEKSIKYALRAFFCSKLSFCLACSYQFLPNLIF